MTEASDAWFFLMMPSCCGIASVRLLPFRLVMCASHLWHLMLSTCARVQNNYKGLCVALTKQLVPVAQRFSMVVCNTDVLGSSFAVYIFFYPEKDF